MRIPKKPISNSLGYRQDASAQGHELREITPLISEVEPNSLTASAQPLDRSAFVVSANPDLARDDLPSITINGSISGEADQDYFRIELNAGELLIIDVDGTGGIWDSFLTIFFNGSELGDNDDLGTVDPGSVAHALYGHNTDSFVSFRAPATGTYYIALSSFEGSSSGAYAMHVSIGPPATAEQIQDENIDALIGRAWPGSNVTYGFPTSADQYGTNGADEIAAGFAPLVGAQMAAVGDVLRLTSGLTNLTFTRDFDNPGSAQMRFARSSDPDTAHAYLPGPGNGGDSWYNMTDYNAPQTGNYAYMTFLHETGHALGLEHGHEWPSPLSPDEDSIEFSVMTYRTFPGQEALGYTAETWGFAQTFMMYDIAALQRLYGANFSTNSGDTVYSWMPGTGALWINGGGAGFVAGANRVFMTIWDGGGNDTYDLSNYTNAVSIDLRPGEWTITSQVQLAYLGGGHYARGNVANALLYNGDLRSLIENAVGGIGNDTIHGNQANNSLDGGAGNDSLFGHLGNDRLLLHGGGSDTADGGAGADIFYYGAAFDAGDSNNGGDGSDVLALQGNYAGLVLDSDSLVDIESLSLLSGTDTRFGQAGGNSYDYSLTFSDANVAAGARFIVNAALLQAGEDFFFNGSAENDGRFLVYAGQGRDTLLGGSGVDWFFFGEAGRFAAGDVVDGGGGNDNLIIRGNYTGGNAIVFAADAFTSVETLTLMTGTDLRFAAGGVDYAYDITLNDGNVAAGQTLTVNGGQLTATEIMTFNGSAETDGQFRIFGSAGQDFIFAGQGNDLIYGGRGVDQMTGNGGNDTFQFDDIWGVAESALGNPDKILDFTRGQDRIDLSLMDADSTLAGDQAFTFETDGSLDGAGQLRAYASGIGSWFVEGDVDGDGVADFRIEVFTDNNQPLTSADFLL